MANSLVKIIETHPFFADLSAEYIALISSCAKNAVYQANEYLFKEGSPANYFYCIREGRVVLELPTHNKGSLQIDSRDEGDVVGWSWIIEPYRWYCDVRATEKVRALVFDARCLRGKCNDDPVFGLQMYHHFMALMYKSLQATHLQLLDVYGAK